MGRRYAASLMFDPATRPSVIQLDAPLTVIDVRPNVSGPPEDARQNERVCETTSESSVGGEWNK